MTKASKINCAREFRKKPTSSEAILWNALRNKQLLNLKFRRQYPIKGFILDFYCSKLKIALEIDGSIHKNEEQKEYDQIRQEIIERHGIAFIRISASEVENNLNQLLAQLKNALKNKAF